MSKITKFVQNEGKKICKNNLKLSKISPNVPNFFLKSLPNESTFIQNKNEKSSKLLKFVQNGSRYVQNNFKFVQTDSIQWIRSCPNEQNLSKSVKIMIKIVQTDLKFVKKITKTCCKWVCSCQMIQHLSKNRKRNLWKWNEKTSLKWSNICPHSIRICPK